MYIVLKSVVADIRAKALVRIDLPAVEWLNLLLKIHHLYLLHVHGVDVCCGADTADSSKG